MRTNDPLSKPQPVSRLNSISFPAAVVVALLLLVLLIILQSPLRANHDVSIHLEMGRRILAGDLPYVGFYNQTLLTTGFLHVPPVTISGLTGVNSISVWLLICWIFTITSVFCSYRLSRRVFAKHASSSLSWLLPLSLAASAWLSLFTSDIGQREYIFTLVAIPWLLYRFCKLEGMAFHALPALAIGSAAGLVATLKPHFFIVLLALECCWILQGRGAFRRLVDASLLGFALAPLANLAYLLAYPDALEGLYRWMLPYLVQGRPNLVASLSAVSVMRLLLPCTAAALALVLAFRRRGADYRLLAGLAVFAAASGGIVVLQSLREFYRLLPLYTGALASCGLMLLLPAATGAPRRWFARRGDLLYGGLLLLVLLTTIVAWQSLTTISVVTPKDLRVMLLDITEPGDDILFMTQWAGIKHPWLRTVDRNEANGILTEWKPPLAIEDELSAESLALQLDITRADIEASPAAIVVDRGAGIRKVLHDSGLLELMESRYQRVGEVQSYTAYAYAGHPPPQGTSFTLGDKFELYSWRLQLADDGAARACQHMNLMTWWRPLAMDIERYALHVDLVKPEGEPQVEQVGRIGNAEDYTAVSSIIDQRRLELPCELQSGEYWLLLSLEDMSVDGGDVLPVRDSSGAEYGKYVFLRDIQIRS